MRVWQYGWLLPLLLVGCSTPMTKEASSGQNGQRKGAVVWADDGTELAFSVISEERQTSPEGEDSVKTSHQIFVQNPDGSQKREVSHRRDHISGALYYMKQAGYLVAESILPTGARRFDRILMNGNEILIIENPEKPRSGCTIMPHALIPAPDGRVLASVYSSDCGQISVEFMYANNLSMIDAQTLDIANPITALWHPDGYLILAAQDGSTAWKVAMKERAKTIAYPRCTTPATSSSTIAFDGRVVSVEEEAFQIKEGSKQAAFGCVQN
jgi:hypothetical protein